MTSNQPSPTVAAAPQPRALRWRAPQIPLPAVPAETPPPDAEVVAPPIAGPPPTQPLAAEVLEVPAAREPWLPPGWYNRLLRRLQSTASFSVSTFIHAVFIIILGLLFVTEKLAAPPIVIVANAPEPVEEIEAFALDVTEAPTLTPSGGGTQLTVPSAVDALGSPSFGKVEINDTAESFEVAAGPRGVLDGELMGEGAYGHTGRGGKGGLYDGSFEGMVEYAQDFGLDIVIVYDSTGSMGGDIAAVKERITRIGTNLLKKIPSARLGICTYKDKTDEFVVKGLPLTNKIDDIKAFLDLHRAGGGGDLPEAVEAGLGWAVSQNEFRKRARKVILIFGDVPPHPPDVGLCCSLADEFFRYQKGIVSTITVHGEIPLKEFQMIAMHGHGTAYAMSDSKRLMEELVVQVFGAKHRAKAVKFFELDKEAMPP